MFLRNRKKGKYTDVEGYNRISRLIEDRQRELTQAPAEDADFDEETVLLTREPAARARAGAKITEEPQAPAAPQAPPTAASMPAEERRIPFQPSAAETQHVNIMPAPPTEIVQIPSMSVPDISATPAQGSLVAAEAVWEGKLVTDGNVRVEGTVHGDVQTAGTLFVAANAHIDGTIQAHSIMLAGEVEGQIQCGERLEVLPGGSARGEIVTGTLVVHEGAYIDSRFQMRQPEPANRR